MTSFVANVTVVKSLRPSLVGQAGIVIQETENTFRVINEGDAIKGVRVRGVCVKLGYPSLVSLSPRSRHPTLHLRFLLLLLPPLPTCSFPKARQRLLVPAWKVHLLHLWQPL